MTRKAGGGGRVLSRLAEMDATRPKEGGAKRLKARALGGEHECGLRESERVLGERGAVLSARRESRSEYGGAVLSGRAGWFLEKRS